MAKNDKLQTYVTYDFKKTINDLSISTTYIPALQSIITKKIMDDPERQETIGDTFKNFDIIVKAANKPDITEEEIKALPQLDQWESEVYTLFSLVQSFKYHAKEQKLEIETETTTTREDFAKLAREAFEGGDITQNLKDIASSLKVVK